jgi:hypothetical protein
MELARRRGYEGDGWHTDKLGRWRSRYWRKWVAANYSGPWRADLQPGDLIVAAHMRYPGCGIATKPADCLIYAMDDLAHKRAHNTGQDDLESQWGLVTMTMVHGIDRRLLLADNQADAWIRSLDLLAHSGRADLSTQSIEYVADNWGRLFMYGALRFNSFDTGPIPY